MVAAAMSTTEPLLTETKSRHVLFPVEYPDIFHYYKLASSSFWLADELNFAQDLTDIEKLTDNERFFITHILAFFAASDGIVSENLSERFSKDVPKPEVRAFYAFQNAMEQVHSETYSLLIDTYIKDAKEKHQLFNAVDHFPAIREKAQWAMRWIEDKETSFAQRLIAFAIVEGLFFSASFCAIFWLRERGLLPGLSFANQLISRDESLHAEFACLLYSKLENRVPQDSVHAMFKEAVDIETRFITESIPCHMIGMNGDLMTEYIQYMADRLLAMLGYARIYNVKNPFPFVETSCLQGKPSFFEVRSSEYSKASAVTDYNAEGSLSVNVDADF
jgi:ribonucleotide reductase beta subunit family protein with ferritin-like domain